MAPTESETHRGDDAPARAVCGARRAWIETTLVFAACLAILASLSRGLGLTWDESIYFRFADSVSDWYRAGADLSQDALARAWAFDPFLNTHPELFRILDAIGVAAFGGSFGFPVNYRLAHLLYASCCLALIYRLIRRRATLVESVGALAFAVLLPRSLGDLLLGNSDSPVMISWLAGAVVAWRLAEESEKGRRRFWRALLVGICAVAGASKVTGVLMLPALAGYFLLKSKKGELLTVAFASLGALILPVLVSPEKWAHPVDAVIAYLTYPILRAGIPIAATYFGRLYTSDLPWHYFLVMSLVTVPLPVWLCLPGLAICPKRWRSLAQILGVSVAIWLVVAQLPSTPRHDGVRQFVSVYPLLALLAWIGFMGYLDRLLAELPRLSKGGVSMLGLSVPLLLASTVVRNHPHELSYYSPIIGGIRGAERLGMETTYYFDALGDASLRALQEHVAPGQTLAMSPFWPLLLNSYRDHGSLPLDFKIVRAGESADWLLLYRRRHAIDDRLYLELKAVHEVRYDDVSLLKLVKRSDIPPDMRYPVATEPE
jgi:hypothetical protein